PRRVGAEGVDDAVEADDVLARLAHLFQAPDGDGAALAVDEAAVVALAHLLGEEPVAAGVLVGLVADHALGEEAGEGLREVEIAAARQGAREEARVEEV